MPMIDVYATQGTFSRPQSARQESRRRSDAVGEGSRDLALQEQHRGLHPRAAGRRAVQRQRRQQLLRVQVLTPVGVLDRDKQLGWSAR